MSVSFLDVDVSLKLTKLLDLSTVVFLSQTCSTLYQLSLSFVSFWIYATDVYRLPITLSDIINNKISAENVRYMALVVHRMNRGRNKRSTLKATQIELRGQLDGLRRLTSDPLNPQLIGTTSMFVQGYKSGSLPWLITMKGNILRCDCIDEAYEIGVEWEAQAPIDWFWRCDIAYSSGDEHLVVALTTNVSRGDLITMVSSGGLSADLYVVKISLPLKDALESINNTSENKPRLRRFQFLKQTSERQQPNNPILKVKHVTHVPLPAGFMNHNCRPTCCGSKVFLMLHHKESSSFWAFIYDWEDNTGVSFKIPKEIRRTSEVQTITGWRKILGFNSTIVFQGWHGPVFAIRIPKLYPLSRSHENTWKQHEIDEDSSQLIHFQDNPTGAEWDPQGDLEVAIRTSARTTEIIRHVFQASETAIYSICRLGSRICCSLHRLIEGGIQGEGTRFTRVAGGFIDIPRNSEEHDAHFSFNAGAGARSVAVTLKPSPSKGWSQTLPSFSVIEFEIDCDYDGRDGVRPIIGSSREFRVKNNTRSVLAKLKGSDLVLERRNIGDVFFDGFRGTVVVLNKDYKEAHIFSYTSDCQL